MKPNTSNFILTQISLQRNISKFFNCQRSTDKYLNLYMTITFLTEVHHNYPVITDNNSVKSLRPHHTTASHI